MDVYGQPSVRDPPESTGSVFGEWVGVSDGERPKERGEKAARGRERHSLCPGRVGRGSRWVVGPWRRLIDIDR